MADEAKETTTPDETPDDSQDDLDKVEEVEDKAKETPDTGDEPVEPDWLDSRLKHAAERAKLSPEQLERFGADGMGVVANLLDGVSTAYAESGRLLSERKAEPKAKEPSKESVVKPSGFDPAKPFALDYGEAGQEQWDKDTQGVLGQMADAIEVMRQQQLPILQASEERQMQEEHREVEAFFSENEADYGDIFGKGPTSELDPDSPQRKAREAVYRQATFMGEAYAAHGREFGVKQVLGEALSIVQGKRQRELAQQELITDVTKRNAQITARPRRRGSKQEPLGPARAVKAVGKVLARLTGRG